MLFSTSLSGDNLQEFYNPKPFQFTCQTSKKPMQSGLQRASLELFFKQLLFIDSFL